jgi:hypothetical protein
MSVERPNQRTAGTNGAMMRLCLDRRFPEAIAAKYLGQGKRHAAPPLMVFRGRAGSFFFFKSHVLVSIPLRLMNRCFLQSAVLFRRDSVQAQVSTVTLSEPFKQNFWKDLTMLHLFFVNWEHVAASPKASSAMTLPGRLAQISPAGIGQQLQAPKQAIGASDRDTIEVMARKDGSTGYEGRFFPLSGPLLRGLHPKLLERIFESQGMMRKEMKIRHMTSYPAAVATPFNEASFKRGQKTVTGGAMGRDLFFQSANKIEHEIEELKRVVRSTEDHIREKVAHQLREIGVERNQKVDIGQITHQVCRNMERMIRIERERRGM